MRAGHTLGFLHDQTAFALLEERRKLYLLCHLAHLLPYISHRQKDDGQLPRAFHQGVFILYIYISKYKPCEIVCDLQEWQGPVAQPGTDGVGLHVVKLRVCVVNVFTWSEKDKYQD